MVGDLIFSLVYEFTKIKSTIGLSSILVNRNFDKNNLPQSDFPAISIAVPENNQEVWISGTKYYSGTLVLSVFTQENDIDWTFKADDAVFPEVIINEIVKNYNLPARIQEYIYTSFWQGWPLNRMANENNLIFKPLGSNQSKIMVKESVNVNVYDISIEYVYIPNPILDTSVPLENVNLIVEMVTNFS